jgi:hypothetical protein
VDRTSDLLRTERAGWEGRRETKRASSGSGRKKLWRLDRFGKHVSIHGDASSMTPPLFESMRALAIVVTLAVSAAAPRAAAQAVGDSSSDQHAWVSGALGVGSVGIAADLSVWYTRRALALGVQSDADDQLFGEQLESLMFLVGASGDWGHDRLVGAVGPASLHSSLCGDDTGCQQGATHLALGFAGEALVHAPVIGIGIDTFGAIGPRRTSHIAVGLSVQLGWLGYAR